MSILSKTVINLAKSRDYNRLLFLIHAIAVAAVVISGVMLIFKILAVAFLLLAGCVLWHHPGNRCQQLVHGHGSIYYMDMQGKKTSYETHRVILDVGLFFLLEVRGEGFRKLLVIFFDQLTADDYRLLKHIEQADVS